MRRHHRIGYFEIVADDLGIKGGKRGRWEKGKKRKEKGGGRAAELTGDFRHEGRERSNEEGQERERGWGRFCTFLDGSLLCRLPSHEGSRKRKGGKKKKNSASIAPGRKSEGGNTIAIDPPKKKKGEKGEKKKKKSDVHQRGGEHRARMDKKELRGTGRDVTHLTHVPSRDQKKGKKKKKKKEGKKSSSGPSLVLCITDPKEA